VIRALCAWADLHRPNFVIRVHAGESPSHPENVRVAIEEARGHSIDLRIGHGLYGVDDATLERIVERKAIVEFNLDSNVALNHLQSARYVPLRRYVDAGVNVVLGSDGYGLYQTTPSAAAQAALLCGLDPSHLDKIAQTETEYIERARARDASRARSAGSYIVPHDTRPKHFKPAVLARRRAEIAARDAAIAARLRELDVPIVIATDGDAFRNVVSRRAVVSIAGAWAHSWDALTADERLTIEREMTLFVEGLDPREAVLLTGGTRFGVEGVVGRAAVKRGLTVVAAIVRATPPAALEAGAFTHACFVGETLYDKAAGLYDLVRAHDGACLFVAGGQIVSDEIQTAKNLRLRYLLMDGVSGASSRHAAEEPARAFRRAQEALHALRGWRTLPVEHVPHWYEGPNPTVDAVVIRDRRDDVGGEALAPRKSIREVLLVLRDLDAPAEPGKWALPGGFVTSTEPRGGRWKLTGESEVEACAREISEETGLSIEAKRLAHLDIYEGGGRDPRDTALSWSRSTAFVVVLRPSEARSAIAGGDDAADARWFAIDALPRDLAFDHGQIIQDALATLKASR
jgi:ADP-ribose pyrophosphatase YjhB (NUDIX family)